MRAMRSSPALALAPAAPPAPPCGEGEVADRDEAAEGHGQVLDLEQRRWRWRCHAALPRSPRSRKLGSRREIRPRGRHTMMATIAAPKISIRSVPTRARNGP